MGDGRGKSFGCHMISSITYTQSFLNLIECSVKFREIFIFIPGGISETVKYELTKSKGLLYNDFKCNRWLIMYFIYANKSCYSVVMMNKV